MFVMNGLRHMRTEQNPKQAAVPAVLTQFDAGKVQPHYIVSHI